MPEEVSPSLSDQLQQAILHLRHDRQPEAESALLALLRTWPDQPDGVHFLGVLRHQQGRSDEALQLIRQALAQMPEHASAWTNLGNVLLHTGQVAEAVQAYERSLQASQGQPQAASPLCNLSTIYRKQGRSADAEAACREALKLVPDFAEAWYNLSIVLMERGELHEALLAHSRAIALWPHHLQGRQQVIRALVTLGERERAADLYREWLIEEPGNPVIEHQLAACLGEDVPERASDRYVEQVFDNFASSFDAKLEALNYRAPQLVAQALAHLAGPPKARLDIVDAGCGTGLCGPLVKPWARRLAGCDLSTGMLRQAVPRHCYDVLHQSELVHYLDTQPSRFDAVMSADTLVYFGDLHAPMAAAHKSLRPGGWLIFTLEALPQAPSDSGGDAAPHQLQPHGRYAHSKAHVQAAVAAAGLKLLDVVADTMRKEAGQPVPGWLVTACKP